jgi:hypothetical protein
MIYKAKFRNRRNKRENATSQAPERGLPGTTNKIHWVALPGPPLLLPPLARSLSIDLGDVEGLEGSLKLSPRDVRQGV